MCQKEFKSGMAITTTYAPIYLNFSIQNIDNIMEDNKAIQDACLQWKNA
jgi:hypothetical protein